MIMRPLTIGLVLSMSATVASAQRAPRCSTETNDADALPRIATAVRAASKSVAAEALTLASALLTENDVCARLRSAVRGVPVASPERIDLDTADWTFFDLGNQYGVLLSPRFDPAAEIVVHAPSTLILFTKDVQPRYIDFMYF